MPAASPKPIRVLLIADQVVVREGLRMLIESHEELKVVGEVNKSEGVAVAAREHPDVVVLDLDNNDGSDADLIPHLLNVAQQTRILALTASDDAELHRRAVQLGAIGLVLKGNSARVLIRAIRKIGFGEAWLDRTMMADVLTELLHPRLREKEEDPEAAKIATLSEREREVIGLVGEGLKNKEIAKRLFISEATVRHHLTSIFAKLEVSDRLSLVIYTYRHGLVLPSR